MSFKLTREQVIQRMYNTSDKVHVAFTNTNDSMYKLFDSISNFSKLIVPETQNISILSDMITDALVITGNSRLSKSSLELSIDENNNIAFESNTNSVSLSIKNKISVPLINNKTYLKSDSNYLTYSPDTKTLLSLPDLLKGNSVLFRSSTATYKYTFALKLTQRTDINLLNIKLNSSTKSYPLLSEVYILKNNSKKYITILNNQDTTYSLDENRVKNNDYKLLFDSVFTDTLYFTLEDRENIDLVLDSIGCYKNEYESTGEIILGPVVSTYPILKASIEAKGDTANSSFYISHNKKDWVEVILPTEVSKTESKNKIISYNTVSGTSYKTDKDVKELYLKIILNKKDNTNTSNSTKTTLSNTLYSNTYSVPKTTIACTVYEKKNNIFYGGTSYESKLNIDNLLPSQISYLITEGVYKVRGFNKTKNSIIYTDQVNNVTLNTNPFKVGSEHINANIINPTTTTVYGYLIKEVRKTYNTLTEGNVVLPLSDNFAKDIYTVRQNNQEIKVDLSLGYIASSLNVIFSCNKDTITLHDSTGKKIKDLTPFQILDEYYVSLIEEGLFILPEATDINFNSLHPLVLNTDNEFGLLDSKLISSSTLLPMTKYYIICKDKIETDINISKENGNTITVIDTLELNKYTEHCKETIKPYGTSRAIKLKNKNIKKGSLRIKQK